MIIVVLFLFVLIREQVVQSYATEQTVWTYINLAAFYRQIELLKWFNALYLTLKYHCIRGIKLFDIISFKS